MTKSIFFGVFAALVVASQAASAQTTQTLAVRISSATDDMERRINGGNPQLDDGSSDLEIGDDGGSRPNTVGLRFVNIGLPVNATVVNAYIQFTGDTDNDAAQGIGTPTVEIRGEATTNSVTFSALDVNDIINRTTTTAAVTWGPIANNWVSSAATINERTPSLTSIVNEIRALPGYTAGSPMTFIIGSNAGNERTAAAFENSTPGLAPQLVIEYFSAANVPGWELYN